MDERSERVRKYLRYEPDTGQLYWQNVDWNGPVRCGDLAGWVHHSGYINVTVGGQTMSAHRIAWFLTHGEWPSHDLDHIDGDTANNRLSNLRLATDSQNGGNQRLAKNNTSGHRGVYRIVTNGGATVRWRAMVMCRGKFHLFGNHLTPEEAAKAASEGRRKLFGEFARDV